MPLPNRVRPDGAIVAEPGRGALTGNRGCLHRDDRTLGVARWRTKAWISCRLHFRGRHRDVMPPGKWTALFFLDEVTALSAGHRPCGECRYADHVAFRDAWTRATGAERRAGEIDAVLHAERVRPYTREKITYPAELGSLPDGVLVRVDGAALLVVGGALRRWSWRGYGAPTRAALGTRVEVLTPPSIVAVVAAGYRPYVHPSVEAPTLRPIAELDAD